MHYFSSDRKPKKNRKAYCKIPHIGIFKENMEYMARNTSILIGEYYESFINGQIATGKYNSVSEVVRTALRHFEQEEIQTKSLIKELEIGENSRKISNFDRNENLNQLHEKFQK